MNFEPLHPTEIILDWIDGHMYVTDNRSQALNLFHHNFMAEKTSTEIQNNMIWLTFAALLKPESITNISTNLTWTQHYKSTRYSRNYEDQYK